MANGTFSPPNTPAAVLDHLGAKVVGVLHGVLPLGQPDPLVVTILFDDGTGLSIRGSFWSEATADVTKALGDRVKAIQDEAASLNAASGGRKG